jgi:flavodoxin
MLPSTAKYSEAYFSINGNTLKLAKTVDYETAKNLSITVKVTDDNSHTFNKYCIFSITDALTLAV